MKKEFGKWLMDVAKYMVTALLLATVFSDMEDPFVIYIVIVLSVVVLIIGLLLVGDSSDKKNINKKRIKK